MADRDVVGRIEQLTQEVRRDLEMRHGYFATLSPEFEQRVEQEVQARLAQRSLTPEERLNDEACERKGAIAERQRCLAIARYIRGEVVNTKEDPTLVAQTIISLIEDGRTVQEIHWRRRKEDRASKWPTS